MILCEELYFEITVKGEKSEIKQFAKFLKSGELDEFFEVTSDYISYGDDYAAAGDEEEVELVFSNDDLGVEIDEFDTDDFLEVFCKAAKKLDASGHLYDISDEEYSFTSDKGSPDYRNAKAAKRFNDELDEAAYDEEEFEED